MSTSSANIAILGPVIANLDGATYYSEKDVEIQITKETKARDVKGSFGTKFDDTLLDVTADIKLMPSQWKNLDKMFAVLAKGPGARVFGTTDKPLVLTSMTEGYKYTWSRAAIIAPPKLGLGVNKDFIGEMTVKCLHASATELSSANSVVALATAQPFADTSFDSTKLFDVPFGVTFGDGSILSAADTEEDGIDLDWDLDLTPQKSGQIGLYDYKVQGLRGKASFTPLGISATNLLALAKMQGPSVRRGAKMSAFAADLVLAGLVAGDPAITLFGAYVGNSAAQGSTEKNLAGAFEFLSVRSKAMAAGALTPLVTFGTVA